MKKTIAKFMAATMLVASLPAMVMPTFTVDAAPVNDSVSITVVKFNGSFQNGNVLADDSSWYSGADKYTNAAETALLIKPAFGMEQTATANQWNTHLQYFKDESTSSWSNPSDKVVNATLEAGTKSITKASALELDSVGDYFDQTGTVKEIKLDSNGELLLTLDATKLTDAKQKELAEGNNNIIEFTPWIAYDNNGEILNKPIFTIQVGETYTAGKTQIDGCSTPDGFVKEATITLDASGNATLLKVSTTDKKVNMKGQKIELSVIEVGGVDHNIVKFEEQALKNAKMKRVTAKNVKNLETGALRSCKKLTKVNMGGAKMRKIHSNAFLDDEKLKNVKINVKNLKSVGSKAFKGLKKNCKISLKCKQKKFKEVVKKIKKSGVDKVKFKRV
jgi:hypothetical protein